MNAWQTSLPIVVLVVSAAVAAQEPNWVGENVLPTKGAKEIKFVERVEGYDGIQVVFPFSGRWPFKVRDEKDGWLRLHDGRREGWVMKSDFVLSRLAADYFGRRIAANPKDSFALSMRGAYWLDKKEPDKAIADFDRCLALNAVDAVALNNRGLAWAEKKEYDRAIADYTDALRINPKNTVTYANRGVALRNKKDWDLAIEDYSEAIRQEATFANAWAGRGAAYLGKKDYDKAIADLNEAIRLDARHLNAYNDRGLCWVGKKDHDKALFDFTEALRLNPKNVVVLANRAASWKNLKSFTAAIGDYEAALRIDPKYARAHANLAWILATCPDDSTRNGKRAVDHAAKACELSNWKDGSFIDALAAAHAETGQFELAVRYERQALEQTRFEIQSGNAARQRLKLYENRKPYRE